MTDPRSSEATTMSQVTIPRPRPKQGPKHSPKQVLSLLVMAVALFAALGSSSENDAKKADEGGGSSSEAASDEGSDGPEVFAVGDLVELGDWQVRVHGVTDPLESSDPIFAPTPGHRWVAVDVEVTNRSDQTATVSSMLCLELKDATNTTYDQTVTGASTAATPDGDVAAGASLRGTVEYEIPADATGLRLDFSCDLLTPGTATIALS
jgi:uncharacterized protein DUF4352